MMTDLEQAIAVLSSGGTILCPTDTVWGISCDATSDEAIAKIYQIKKRASSKSMICLVSDDAMLERYIKNIPDVVYDLIDCTDKPTTIIYDDSSGLSQQLLAEDGSVGVRIVRSGFIHQLIRKYRKPIISTSANFSGMQTSKNFEDIPKDLSDQVDYIVNEKEQERSTQVESSVIKISNTGEVTIIRK